MLQLATKRQKGFLFSFSRSLLQPRSVWTWGIFRQPGSWTNIPSISWWVTSTYGRGHPGALHADPMADDKFVWSSSGISALTFSFSCRILGSCGSQCSPKDLVQYRLVSFANKSRLQLQTASNAGHSSTIRLLDRLLQVSRLCRYSRHTELQLNSRWRRLLKWFFTARFCWPYILNCCLSEAKGNSYERAGTLGFRCAADVHGGAPEPYHYRQFDIEFVWVSAYLCLVAPQQGGDRWETP